MIQPFRAWVYRTQPRVAPVIDALSPTELQALRADPFQAIHIAFPTHPSDLPHLWQKWLQESVLTPEPLPVMYAYSQTFYRYGERAIPHQRIGIIAALPTATTLLPHEAVLPERILGLQTALAALPVQTTPIHVLAAGAWENLRPLLQAYLSCPRFSAASSDGVMHRWSPIHHRGHQEHIAQSLPQGPFFIADGHHRWQAILRQQLPYFLAYITPTDDPSLYIAPTHRFLPHPHIDLAKRMEKHFSLHPTAARVPLWAEVQGLKHAIGIVAPGGKAWTARLRPPYWSYLQERPLVAWVHEWVLQGLPVQFSREPAPLVEAAHRGEGWACLLPPLDIAYVWQAAQQGNPLPAKATYFFPKVLSGLCFAYEDSVSVGLPAA
ncbi:MAG: DUF1015 domain-containing protein [Bacteroidia bacterium]|nr:DUF1015 domain-containing protein [Bacteroidia bacterium]GIV23153.1 MAG: hypothetical protein KatS3mg025_0812 [Bacteroidia bacterium]